MVAETEENLVVLDHPVLQEILTRLREKGTSSPQFRAGLRRAGYHQTYEILGRECVLSKMSIDTVFQKTSGFTIREKILQVMVMRAGQPHAEGGAILLDELETRRAVGVVDACRREPVAERGSSFDFDIELGSFKVPDFDENTLIIVYDPMLASGSTLKRILNLLAEHGTPKAIVVCSIIAARHGVRALVESHPHVRIYTLAVDEGGDAGLNEAGFIVPGLGDAGDRAFGEYHALKNTKEG